MPRLALAALIAALTLPGPLAGQLVLVDDDRTALVLGGYVQSVTGVHDLGYEIPERPLTSATPRRSGFHGQVIRLKWRLEGGPGAVGSGTRWRIDVHDRIQARVSNGGDTRAVGFGVSAVPDRLVDLETELVDEPGLRVWHDLDRLSVTLYTDAADITVGRQAITWGTSGIFPVADLWAQFSPFELDTEEKPGIDAVRILAYPHPGLELDAVAADRGSADDFSAGIRGTYGLPGADVWAGTGKFWRQLIAMGGVTLLLDEIKLRAEVAVPWDLDTEALQDPRATAGFDWIRGDLAISGEYHYNGIGTVPDDYLSRLDDPRLRRGETYYLGRRYLGATVRWSPDVENRLALVLNAMTNLQDPSTALTPFLNYDLGQAIRLSLGALLSFGDAPSFAAVPPSFPSEFGAYGTLGFTQLSVYF